MINELEIRTTNFMSLHKLFDFLQPSKLKDITNDELDIHIINKCLILYLPFTI